MFQELMSHWRPVFRKQQGEPVRLANIDVGGNERSLSDKLPGNVFHRPLHDARDRNGWPPIRRAQQQVVLVDVSVRADHPERHDAVSEESPFG
jgi:hypothetical protein